MRVAIIGQHAFGEAVLGRFLESGHDVSGVFCPPTETKPDPLDIAANAAGVPVFRLRSYAIPEAREALASCAADLAVMAYVTAFAPQSFLSIPKFGAIQFHPSLLPEHRGPSSISWPIIIGKKETGFTIFRPVDGLDEGPVLFQHKIPIAPDDTLGSVYFNKIFPYGVEALASVAEAVAGGVAEETPQDSARATYEGWLGGFEARIDWAKPVDQVYNLIRGCNPSPGAWTRIDGEVLRIYDARKRPARTFAEVKGLKPGQVIEVEGGIVGVHAPGGFIEIHRCARGTDRKKVTPLEASVFPGVVMGA